MRVNWTTEPDRTTITIEGVGTFVIAGAAYKRAPEGIGVILSSTLAVPDDKRRNMTRLALASMRLDDPIAPMIAEIVWEIAAHHSGNPELARNFIVGHLTAVLRAEQVGGSYNDESEER